jgi:hypothetical protein
MANQVNYKYVYYSVRDYTGNETLSSYTLSNTPLTFKPNFELSFSPNELTNISNKKVTWDFGDGTTSTDLTATHQYRWPGNYTPILTIYDRLGNAFDSSYQPTISIYNFVYDQLVFEDYRKFIYDVPASKINDPLTVNRQSSWQSYNALSATGYTVNLYASGAAGDYLNIDNFFDDKWSHLRALSRFIEKVKVGSEYEYVPVNKLVTSNQEIYCRINDDKQLEVCEQGSEGSVFAGTTGSCVFYYVDDRAKNFTSREFPIFLFATLDSSKFQDKYSFENNAFDYIDYPPYGFQMLKPAVLPIIKVRHNPAKQLSISTTGIEGEGTLSSTKFDIPNVSWQNTEIPFVVKMRDNENFTTKTYPPLSSSTVNTALTSLTSYNLTFGLVQHTDTGTVPYTAVKFYEDFTADAPQSIGAFFKGYFVPQETALNVSLTAHMVVQDPINFPKDSLIGWIAVPQFNVLLRFFNLQIYDYCKGYLDFTTSASGKFFYNYENRNVYSIQVAPSGSLFGSDYQTWFADGTTDNLFKFDSNGNILSSFALSCYPAFAGMFQTTNYVDLRSEALSSAAPGSIAMDGNSDLWVALFDAVSAIKIDKDSGHIKAIAYPDTANIVYALSSDYNLPQLQGFAGENLLLPASVDTDINNNVWITYTHPVSNFLVKYDTNGTVLRTITFPYLHSPVELCVDRNRNVWLTTYNLTTSARELTARNDYLYKFDSEGNVLPGYPLSGFKLIGNIAVDGQQNAWVAQDRQTITKIDALTRLRTDYIAGSGNNTNYIQSFGGLACDTSSFIWAINNFDQKLYFIDATEPPKPINEIPYIDLVMPGSSVQNPVSTFEEKSFQAYGDWLGSKWLNKYIDDTSTIRVLTGESNLFNLYPLSGEFNISKINEDFDASSYYKSLILNETLEDRYVFFNDFLGTIVGNLTSQPYELGKTVYEKIANYVSNNSDIDAANLDQLLSFCKELSVQFEQYNYPFPPQLARLVNILSIKHKKLWGERNKFNLQFENYGLSNNKNLGTQLSTLTSVISSGYSLVAYEKFSNAYLVVNNVEILSAGLPLNYGTKIPLSAYNYDWGWGLVSPKSLSGDRISDFYSFYNYIPTYEDSYRENIIDWDNPLTTLTFTNSSFAEWSRDSGIMQNILSYELTKGLRLFLSASDLVYNN